MIWFYTFFCIFIFSISVVQAHHERVQNFLLNNWWLCVTVLQNTLKLLHRMCARVWIQFVQFVHALLVSGAMCDSVCVWYRWTPLGVSRNTTQIIFCEGTAASSPLHLPSPPSFAWSLNQQGTQAHCQHNAVLSNFSDPHQVTAKLKVNGIWCGSDQQRELRPAHPSQVLCHKSIFKEYNT